MSEMTGGELNKTASDAEVTGSRQTPHRCNLSPEGIDGEVGDGSRPAVEFPRLPSPDVRFIDLDARN